MGFKARKVEAKPEAVYCRHCGVLMSKKAYDSLSYCVVNDYHEPVLRS